MMEVNQNKLIAPLWLAAILKINSAHSSTPGMD